ncbi:MAG: 6-pyruvoyl trahydropterin synthase family protein [Actinomycetota bacterium]
MSGISVTRRETFSAGHRLFDPALDDAKNYELFGPCANPNGHGHNYVLEVTVEDKIDESTGYVFDLKRLSDLMKQHIIDDIDHRNLNLEVTWLQGRNPTTEVLAEAIWQRLDAVLPPGTLARVVVRETEKNWAERRR